MATLADLTRTAQSGQPSGLQLPPFPKLSEHAPDVVARFPSVLKWEAELEGWVKKNVFNIRQSQDS